MRRSTMNSAPDAAHIHRGDRCPRDGWPLSIQDRHCGICGRQIVSFRAESVDPRPIYMGVHGEVTRVVRVTNAGLRPLDLELVSEDDHAVSVQPAARSCRLQCGASVNVNVRVNVDKCGDPVGIRVRVAGDETTPHDDDDKHRVEFRVHAKPRVRLARSDGGKPLPVQVAFRRSDTEVTLDLPLLILGSVGTIQDVRCAIQGWKDADYPTGSITSGDDPIPMTVRLDPTTLANGSQMLRLQVKLREIVQPFECVVDLSTTELPRIHVDDAVFRVLHGRTRDGVLVIRSDGAASCEITQITAQRHSSLLQFHSSDLPRLLEPGRTVEVRLRARGDALPPGDYEIPLEVHADEGVPTRATAGVTVLPLRPYPGYIGIDFGTTNSACAYEDPDTHRPRLVPLERGATGTLTVIPSDLVYARDETVVGASASDIGRRNPADPSYVRSVKRFLGSNDYRTFPDGKKRQPRDVALDVIRFLVARTEEFLEHEVTQCVFTHPTCFGEHQVRDLEWVLGEQLRMHDLQKIDEASAAAYEYIERRREAAGEQEKPYTLLVCDFGGGTTDIALSAVDPGDELRVTPLRTGGNPTFGGDDVTDLLAGYVVDELRARIQTQHPELRFEIPYVAPMRLHRVAREGHLRTVYESNASRLFSRAEQIKHDLTTATISTTQAFADVQVDRLTSVSSIEDLGIETGVVIRRADMDGLLGEPLRRLLEDIDEMSREANALPEVILLAGQASRPPFIEQAIREHFMDTYGQDPAIETADDPKALVALGAWRHGLVHDAPDAPLHHIGDAVARTPFRLGIRSVRYSRPVFREMIPRGSTYPAMSELIAFPLRGRDFHVYVRQHFASGDDLQASESLGSAHIVLPDLPGEVLSEARAQLVASSSNEFLVRILMGDDEHDYPVELTPSAFVVGEN